MQAMARFLAQQDYRRHPVASQRKTAAKKLVATTPGAMKNYAALLLASVEETASAAGAGSVDAGKTHATKAYLDIFDKQLAALEAYFPILETEAWRLVATTADISKTLEQVNAFEFAVDHLEDVASILITPDTDEPRHAALAAIKENVEVLSDELEMTQARNRMFADADSLLTRATRWAEAPRESTDAEQLRADFRTQLGAIKDHLKALEEQAGNYPSSAAGSAPSVWRLALAQAKACDVAAGKLDDARTILFEKLPADSTAYQNELAAMEGDADILIHALGRLTFDAELRLLQDRLDSVASTVRQQNHQPGETTSWRAPLMLAKICRNDAARLTRDVADVFDQDSHESEESGIALNTLNALQGHADNLIGEISNRIGGEADTVSDHAEAFNALTRTPSRVTTSAESLCIDVKRCAGPAGISAEKTQLQARFHAQLDLIRESLAAIKRRMDQPPSAALEPSEWRLMRAQARACAVAGDTLGDAEALLFDAEESEKMQAALAEIEGLADELINDIKPREFDAELRSLQQLVADLRLEIPRRNEAHVLRSWRNLQLAQIRSCENRAEKLKRNLNDAFDEGSEQAQEKNMALIDLGGRLDELSRDLKGKVNIIHSHRRTDSIPEESDDNGSPPPAPIRRMSTFNLDADNH